MTDFCVRSLLARLTQKKATLARYVLQTSDSISQHLNVMCRILALIYLLFSIPLTFIYISFNWNLLSLSVCQHPSELMTVKPNQADNSVHLSGKQSK